MERDERREIFRFLCEDIKSTVFATVDEDGLPHTCVINIVSYDDDAVYFLTARGKRFYREVAALGFGALTGKHGKDTMSTKAISLRGKIEDVGTEMLDEIFRANPYLNEIYRTEESRRAITIFRLSDGDGEFFDLSAKPPRREIFTFGNGIATDEVYRIEDGCIACGECARICPSSCIEEDGMAFSIDAEHCIRCGNCMDTCEYGAVVHDTIEICSRKYTKI